MTMSLADALKRVQGRLDESQVILDSIAGFQVQVADLLVQVATLTSDKTELTEQLAIARATIAQDAADIARLQSDLVARDQTIREQAARIQELEDQLDDEDPPPPSKPLLGWFPGPLRFPNTGPVETKADMRARCIAAFGGPPAVERIYNEGSWTVPAPGQPAIVSFTQSAAAVAAGTFDTQIRDFVNALDPATRYWLVLNQEADNPDKHNDPAQQRAGVAHFADVIHGCGKPNVLVATILMSYTITGGQWSQWLPDVSYLDAFGANAYWRPYLRTPAAVYDPAIGAAATCGLPLIIGETSLGAAGHGGKDKADDGTFVDIDEATWTDFTRDAIAYLTDPAHNIDAVTWFETNKTDGRWLHEGHPAGLALWAAAVQASL